MSRPRVVVAKPPAQDPYGQPVQDDGITVHGVSVGPAVALQILYPGIYGGRAGSNYALTAPALACSPIAVGGGTLGLRVGGSLRIDGLISATGESGQSANCYSGGPVYGAGGGGGGVIIAAVQVRVSGTGTIDVSGGNGGDEMDISSPQGSLPGANGAGGGGGLIHIICPNPVPQFNFVYAGGNVGQGSASPYGIPAGASGGNSGGHLAVIHGISKLAFG